MKLLARFYVLLFTFCFFCSYGQPSIIEWIDENSVNIVDNSQKNNLPLFDRSSFPSFNNAKIFGFGESTHNAKEFFDLKAKFFKYLVQNNGVRTFIIEDHYQIEGSVNNWIKGGDGDITEIVKNLTQFPWRCKEVVELLTWMREYNHDKLAIDQIKFYGMDSQVAKGINVELRSFVKEKQIFITEDLLRTADSCSNHLIDFKPNAWAAQQLPKLEEIKSVIKNHQKMDLTDNIQQYNRMLRALDYLSNHINFVENPTTIERDEQMYKNVLEIIKISDSSHNIFIWTHNEHINKQGHSKSIINLGNRLKTKFGKGYYCVGFDFGTGRLRGFQRTKNKTFQWDYNVINEPFKNTFSETLMKAKFSSFFVDLENAATTELSDYFKVERKHLTTGGSGYNPKKPVFIKRSYIESYDALIFVKKISDADYKL